MGLIHDTVQLCIPEHIAIKLQLRQLEQRDVILAVFFCKPKPAYEMLLGAIPMQDIDLVLRPR